jgi:DNA-binding PucR family transcriptional regulator
VLSGTVDRVGGAIVLLALNVERSRDIAADIDRALERVDAGALRASVGEVAYGLAQLGASCREALTALDATAAAAGEEAPRGTVRYSEALLPVLVHRDHELARQIADHCLAPLAEHPVLLETLRAHLRARLAPSTTASVLGVHKNTVAYRLQRISELSGLDLHDPHDIAHAVLALYARRELDRAGG